MSPFISDSSNTFEYPIIITREHISSGDYTKTVEDMVSAIAEKVRDLAEHTPNEHFQIITYGAAGFFYPAAKPEFEVKDE